MRLILVTLTAVIVGIGVALVLGNIAYIGTHGGEDLHVYLEHTRHWLDGGNYYDARQLTGRPYERIDHRHSVYPPPSVLFFLPFLWVPELAWWLMPLGVIAVAVARLKPAAWTWPLIALCAVATAGRSHWRSPPNSSMWVAAVVAASLVWAVPAVFILLKPSLAPFVVFGIDRRSWWRGLAVLGIASLAMLPMWPDWITAITNIRGDDWTHNGFDVAFILIPILAFMGSSDRSHHVVVLSPLRDWVVRRATGVDDGG